MALNPIVLVSLSISACGSSEPQIVQTPGDRQPGLLRSEFISVRSPTHSNHASTVVETRDGLMAAWFGGPHEGHPEVAIWASRYEGGRWTAATQVADGIQVDGKSRYPTWNPVLFQPRAGPLMLFYKVGPSPSEWWGMLQTSPDNGRSWSKPRRLPDTQVGPVRNKPVQWADGSLLCGSSTEDSGWRIHMERTPDLGLHWERSPPINDDKALELIQPTILQWSSGKIQILLRSKQGKIYESWMDWDWKSWSVPRPIDLPNPNSAIDAVMLQDGRALLVYNHSARNRSPLNVAISEDGRTWQAVLVLENGRGEYSYPAVIQSRDGLVHITYTWKRERIKHVVVDPQRLRPRPMMNGRWPE
jgi:predicted neuraminidase